MYRCLRSLVSPLTFLFLVPVPFSALVGCGSDEGVAVTGEEAADEEAADGGAAEGEETAAPATVSLHVLRVDTFCTGVATSQSLTGVGCVSGSPMGFLEGETLRLTDPFLQGIAQQVDREVSALVLEGLME